MSGFFESVLGGFVGSLSAFVMYYITSAVGDHYIKLPIMKRLKKLKFKKKLKELRR